MSTIHRPAPVQIWWYAAAAVLTALVAVLAVTVLAGNSSSPGNDTVPLTHPIVQPQPWHAREACFAERHGAPPELVGVCDGRP
jgi:hypothetical protein